MVNEGAGESDRMARRSSSRSAALSTIRVSICFRVFATGSHLQKPAFVRVDELGILKALFAEFGLKDLEFHVCSLDISFSEGFL